MTTILIAGSPAAPAGYLVPSGDTSGGTDSAKISSGVTTYQHSPLP